MRTPLWLSRNEVRGFDRRAIEEFTVPSLVLMENAGRGAAELFASLHSPKDAVMILAGRGNNGGDGFVIARHLQLRGFRVEVLVFADTTTELSFECQVNFEIAQRGEIPILNGAISASRIEPRHFIIDALYGTGLSRPLKEPYTALFDTIEKQKNPVFAIDIPSGMDCDTGEPLGPTLKAKHTATFVGWKKGFLNPASRVYTGEIHVVDIGVPMKLLEEYRQLPEQE